MTTLISMYSACLVYLVGPSIIQLIYQTEDEGDTASFTCQADGEPLPTISWYFNGAPLDESNTAKYMITERLTTTTAARGLMAYISGKSRVHMLQVICNTSGTLKICPNLMSIFPPLYIVTGTRCDCGTLFHRRHDVLAW